MIVLVVRTSWIEGEFRLGRKPSDRVTLNDVAEKVGVAPSTVSYILRKVEPHFSRYAKDTIEKVEQAAAEVGYAPSMLATSLRLGQVPFFGIFFEFVRPGDVSPSGGMSSMMWQVYEGIASAARKQHRYPVVLTSPDPGAGLADSPEELERVVRSGLAGVIAAVFPDTWRDHLARWEAAGVPCISLFDHGDADLPRTFVDLDNHAVGRLAWQHLREHGHKHVTCLYPLVSSAAISDRIEGFRQARAEDGLDTSVVQLDCPRLTGDRFDQADAERVLSALKDARATAFFGTDGGVTVITYEVLTSHGVNVPQDCSLIGIDVPTWSGAAPFVTEVACPGRRVGEAAAQLLDDRIGGKNPEAAHVLVDPVLMRRTTVARCPAQ
jgi:LacI family transcriptional regulator